MTLIPIIRRPGWTDEYISHVPGGDVQRKRRIGRSLNHLKLGASDYEPTVPGMAQGVSAPPHWEGGWDFTAAGLESLCQVFARGTSQGLRHMWGMRRADEPPSWVNILWANTTPGIEPQYETPAKWTYPLIYTDCTLQLEHAGDFVRETMIVGQSGQTSFDVSLRAPGRLAFDIDEDARLVRLLRNGDERLFLRYRAEDSATLTADGGPQPVGLTLADLGMSQGNRVIRLTLDPGDLATAVWPVKVVN